MFDESQWEALVAEISRLTDAEKLHWAPEETVFVAKVGPMEYVMGSVDNDQRAPYFLGIWNPESREYVARLESQPRPDASQTERLTAAQFIPDLYKRVRRAATGTDRLFSSLLTDLKGLEDRG
ncbi:hypothetical protein [Microbacterium sp. CR_7]|uniref:hypothetical protein n=1 Tax=Microbacterium sp. CR_7 TaxID=3055792 RepID=UPI0035BFC314